MAQSRSRTYRVWATVALLFAGTLSTVGLTPAAAQVTAVRGSAFGYSLTATVPGSSGTRGPEPTVTLPAGGSATPVTASLPSATVILGPANLFSSGLLEVSTQGTPGGGSVTSSSRITNLNTSQNEVLTAASLASTCTASATGVSGSTTITGGTLLTDSGDDNGANSIPDHPPVTINLPANPTVNQTIEGHLHVGDVTDNFTIVLNEQTTNADGSITVTAVHQILRGPLATGDIYIGQSVCGVTGSAATTTTTGAPGGTTTTAAPGATTTTTAPGATTTSAPGATTTTAPGGTTTTTIAPPATTTTAPSGGTGGVGGGAYGFYVSISLFNAPAATRGPVPTVSLPAAGSATPVTASAPSGNGVFGPATIFSSGALDVSTEGTPGGTVTSSAKVADVNKSGQEVFTASSLTSRCTASASGLTGSTTVAGGKLITSEVNPDIDEDDITVTVPADPAPNTTFEGKIETVGDTFRYIFNEQIRNADGSITVNAAHMRLLGPTAVGELIIGQSRCSITAGGAAASAGGGGGGSGSGGLVNTGLQAARLVAIALALLSVGWGATVSTAGAQLRRRVRSMPWDKRRLLR